MSNFSIEVKWKHKFCSNINIKMLHLSLQVIKNTIRKTLFLKKLFRNYLSCMPPLQAIIHLQISDDESITRNTRTENPSVFIDRELLAVNSMWKHFGKTLFFSCRLQVVATDASADAIISSMPWYHWLYLTHKSS